MAGPYPSPLTHAGSSLIEASSAKRGWPEGASAIGFVERPDGSDVMGLTESNSSDRVTVTLSGDTYTFVWPQHGYAIGFDQLPDGSYAAASSPHARTSSGCSTPRPPSGLADGRPAA